MGRSRRPGCQRLVLGQLHCAARVLESFLVLVQVEISGVGQRLVLDQLHCAAGVWTSWCDGDVKLAGAGLAQLVHEVIRSEERHLSSCYH